MGVGQEIHAFQNHSLVGPTEMHSYPSAVHHESAEGSRKTNLDGGNRPEGRPILLLNILDYGRHERYASPPPNSRGQPTPVVGAAPCASLTASCVML